MQVVGKDILLEMKTFKRGDLFGAKSLLGEVKTSKVNLVVESKEAEILMLDVKNFVTLPELFQKDIKRNIERMREFDEFDVEKVKRTFG